MRYDMRERADIAVAAVCVISVLAFLGRRDIDGVRERRIAGTAADIVRHGHWLIPELRGKPRILKPPLADWLAAVSIHLFGHNEFAFRLPFALAGLGTIGASWWLGRRTVGETAARIAALLLASSAYFISECHSASTDLLLGFFSAASLASWWAWQRTAAPWTAAWWSFYLCLAVACLAKGPIALAIVAIPIVLELWVSGRWRLALAMRPCWGLLIVAAAALPWPLAVSRQIDDAPARWLADMRLSLLDGHEPTIWDYLGHVSYWPWFCFPWSVLGIGVLLLPLVRRDLAAWPQLRFCYFWLVGDLVLFCTWAAQPLHYLLPLAAPLAVLEAAVWLRIVEKIRGGLARSGEVLAVCAGIVVGSLGLAVAVGCTLHARTATPVVLATAVAGLLLLPTLVATRWLCVRPERSFALCVTTGLACVAVFSGWIKPQESRHAGYAEFARRITSATTPGEPVYFCHFDDALPFYADREFRPVNEDRLPTELEARDRGCLVVSRAGYESALAALRPQVTTEIVLENRSHTDPAKNLLLVRFQPIAVAARETAQPSR